MRPAHVEVIYRPHSRYQRSLHAHKDWWDKCNVTWFLRAQTSNKICQYKKSRLCLLILDNRKRRTFYLKDNNGKLWVDVIVVIFFNAVGTVDVLTASNDDVKLVETWTVYFANVKLPYRFEKINKLDRNYSYWDILSLVCPLKYRVTFFFIPSILERVQRWRVSWIRSITSCYWLSFIYFPYSSCLSFIFHSSIHPSPQLYSHRSFLPSFIPLLNLNQWSVFISLFMVKYSNLVAVFTNHHIRLRVPTFF